MRCLLILCLLLTGLFVSTSFAEPAITPDWQVHCSKDAALSINGGEIGIQSPVNAFAHVSATLAKDQHPLTVSARITPSNPTGVTWCTSIFFAWDGGNWCQMGIIDQPGGGGRRFYAVETEQGATKENYLANCAPDRAHFVKIQIGKDCIRYFGSDDGLKWTCLRTIERPVWFVGPPTRVVAGKGYGRGAAPYPKDDLDNDYADLGPQVSSKISDVRLEITPAAEQALTAAERKAMREADCDRVGNLVLKGTADPTYEQVSKHYPPMLYPKEAVGVPEHPLDICVDHLGRLQLNYNTPLIAWLTIDDPPVPFGEEKAVIRRRLLDGYKPAVVLTTSRDGVKYEQTVFGWSEGFSADKQLYAYVRLTAHPTAEKWGSGALPNKVSLMTPDAAQRMDFSPAAKGRGFQVCLRFPWPNPSEAVAVTPAEFEKTLKSTSEFWQKQITPAARFEVPDKRVSEAYRAWIAYSKLLVDKVHGVYEPHDGTGFYEENYGYSALLHCIALDQYGLHAKAEQYLDSILHFQQPNGLYTQNFGLPDQGTLLTALAEHYRLTGDAKWLRRIAPKMILAGNWLIEQRKNAPKEGVTKGLIKFRPYCDYAEPEYNYYSEACSCVGLEDAAFALKAIGMTGDAARFAAEAKQYRADILASMDAAVIKRPDITMLPLVPDTHRLLKMSSYTGGEYYGLVASCLLDSGFLPAKDKRASWIIDFMEKKKGLTAGLCKFGPDGVDHAYTYGYLMTQMQRGDARKVLLGFWSMLAYGMTRETYSGVECTSIATGANYWTLPHLYSSTQQLRLLRNMLLREDGDTLRIGDAIPRAWLVDSNKIGVNNAPTRFGDVSYAITSSAKKGAIHIKLAPPTRNAPKLIHITLRHPKQTPIRSVLVNGRKWIKFGRESIELDRSILSLPKDTKPVTLEVRY